ncbi:unnamed protein product [Microthlaspi erraticum]|uniref:MATH domain-containing protein n=1 Tax=Microthlaspi erraticum TaxID=1685480 RepID=A0A6D2IVU3_9BRAS|nr:unnamed protein product [Microthlaspi erraticum]
MGAVVSSNVVLDEEIDTSSSTLQIWRERPPSSYSIKVQILSKLQSSTFFSDGKYQSRRFFSGGYNWRMIIYPKGNTKDNGGGFISMYVEIDSTSFVSKHQDEVYADIRFFVFNKKENKYFTIQDKEPKPFNTLRTVWGFPRVLPLDTFNNHKNGYVFDGDHCEFGVDVFVAPPPTKLEIISFGEKLPYPKFSWTRRILAHLRLFQWEERNVNWWLEKGCLGFGFDHFMSSADLRKSYLDNEDTLKVEIEFKAVSATKYSS